MRVDLPSGGWAEVRDPDTVTERTRRALVGAYASLPAETIEAARAAQEAGETPDIHPGDYEAMMVANDHLVVALVTAWSFGETVTADALLDLTPKDYDALAKAVADVAAKIQVDFSPAPDPDSPTPPSSA